MGKRREEISQCQWNILAAIKKQQSIPNEHTKRRLKKSSTSFVVDGPPMFIKTIAVGPFEPVAS
jgi:hypothetical protein